MRWAFAASLLAVVMGFAATATIPTATASLDDVSLRFLPADTQGIGHIDVAALRTAPLVEEALKSGFVGFADKVNEIARVTGFDPQRDIDRVTIGKLSGQDGIAIVQGRVDRFKIEQYLKDQNRQTEGYLGQTLYRDGDGAVLLLDNVIVAGQLTAVKKAVDQMQLPGSQPLRPELIEAMRTIEAGNQIWGVGEFSIADLNKVGVRGPAPAMEMLKSLKSGTGQMRIDTGIHIRGTANFSDTDSAKNIADLGRGAIAIAKLQVARQQPDMVQLLDGVQVSSTGTTLTVRIDESGEMLKKLKDLRLNAGH